MLSLSAEAAAEQAGLDQRLHHFLPARPGLGGAAFLSLSLICKQTYQNARRNRAAPMQSTRQSSCSTSRCWCYLIIGPRPV